VPGIGDIIDPLCDTCKFDYDDKYGLNFTVCNNCDGVCKYISDDNPGEDLEDYTEYEMEDIRDYYDEHEAYRKVINTIREKNGEVINV
jgi:hypothetical protein